MCKHEVDVKIENGVIITYCKICGKVLDTKLSNMNYNISSETKESWGDNMSNGGTILHG